MPRFATARAFNLTTNTGKVPEWIKLFPLGDLETRDAIHTHLARAPS